MLAAAVIMPVHAPKHVQDHQAKIIAHRQHVLVRIIEKRSEQIRKYLDKHHGTAEEKALLAQADAKIATLRADPKENFSDKVHEIYQLFASIAKARK